MAANIVEIANGAALIRHDGVLHVINPAEGCSPWWIDADGNYYHPTDFTWELP